MPKLCTLKSGVSEIIALLLFCGLITNFWDLSKKYVLQLIILCSNQIVSCAMFSLVVLVKTYTNLY
jgi:hypothetical protein